MHFSPLSSSLRHKKVSKITKEELCSSIKTSAPHHKQVTKEVPRNIKKYQKVPKTVKTLKHQHSPMQSFPLSLLWQKSTKEVVERSKKYQNIRTLVPHPPFCTTLLSPPHIGKKTHERMFNKSLSCKASNQNVSHFFWLKPRICSKMYQQKIFLLSEVKKTNK